MTNFEKGVKTFAIVLAIILCIGVFGGIVSIINGVVRGIHYSAEAVSAVTETASEIAAESAEQAHTYFQNDVDNVRFGKAEYYFSTSDVDELKIENGVGEMKILETDNEEIHVAVGSASDICSVQLSGSTLKIENCGVEIEVFGVHIGERVEGAAEGIIVEVPKGFRFDEVQIVNGIGNMEIEGLHAEEMEIENGTGSLKCVNMDGNDIDIEASVGQVEMEFSCPMNTYDMRLKPGIGSIYINGIKQNELSHTNKEAEQNIRIVSSIGSVYVNFSDN